MSVVIGEQGRRCLKLP